MSCKKLKYNCCVPGCNNGHRNRSTALKFYCIPKDSELQKAYVLLLKNDSLKIDSCQIGGRKTIAQNRSVVFPAACLVAIWNGSPPKYMTCIQ